MAEDGRAQSTAGGVSDCTAVEAYATEAEPGQ